MFKRRFQRGLCWNQVKYASITFYCMTLAGSVGRCLNTRPNGLVLKQLPRDPTNVNARKTCVIPTFLHGNSLREAVWSCKIYVKIMGFTCFLNMAFTWKSLSWPWYACITLHWKALQPWLIISPMLSFAKTLRAYIWRCGDVMTFESWHWHHFNLRHQV